MSLKSTKPNSSDSTAMNNGDKVYLQGLKKWGIVRFYGITKFSEGIWVGIELSTDAGRNDGTVSGIEYFKCKPKYGLFVRPGNCSKRIPAPAESAREEKKIEHDEITGQTKHSSPTKSEEINYSTAPSQTQRPAQLIIESGEDNEVGEESDARTPRLRAIRRNTPTGNKVVGKNVARVPRLTTPNLTATAATKTVQNPKRSDSPTHNEGTFDNLLSRLQSRLLDDAEIISPSKPIESTPRRSRLGSATSGTFCTDSDSKAKLIREKDISSDVLGRIERLEENYSKLREDIDKAANNSNLQVISEAILGASNKLGEIQEILERSGLYVRKEGEDVKNEDEIRQLKFALEMVADLAKQAHDATIFERQAQAERIQAYELQLQKMQST